MPLVTKATAATHTTPNAVMITYSGPSRGSAELSMWHVQMQPGASGPAHLIDKEQVYLVTAGQLTIDIAGRGYHAGAGDAVIIPAGIIRQVHSQGSEPARAVVSMAVGGRVTVDGEDRGLLPWAT